MHIRCPHCHHAVEVVGSGAFESVQCPSCGSQFDLLPDSKTTWRGQRTIGHFELLDELGSGSFGTVWKARDTQLERLVAIKVPRIDKSEGMQGEFLREARAAGQLRHPHIVAIHEVGRENGTLYIVSDFIQGITLAQRLTTGAYAPREAAKLLCHVAEALHHAHQLGVIHRDLKPQNIMLDGQGRPLLMDFGLAKREAAEITMTMAGRILGTPAYMSPEQARGEGNRVDGRSDVYSLGVILFELLTGERPFRGHVQMLIHQVIHDEAPSPRKLNARIPRDLETICLKCLEKLPSRRYDTAQDVANELQHFLDGQPIQARPVSRVTRFWRLCKRNPVSSSSIAAMVLMGLSALTAVSIALAHSNRSLRRESAALAQSEQSLQEALAAVNDLFTTVSENTLLNQPGLQNVREGLLQKALDYYERFLKQRGNDPAIQDELAAAYFRVGRIKETLGSLSEALNAYQVARQMQERRLSERPEDPAQLMALGNTLNALGNSLARLRNTDAARSAYEEASNIRARLVATDASNSEHQRLLASTIMNIGVLNYTNAETAANGDDAKPAVADARARYEEAQSIRRAALERDATNLKLRRDLAKAYYNLGNLESTDKNYDAAIKNYEQAAAEVEKLADGSAAELGDRALLAICYRRAGDHLAQATKWNEARRWYEKALNRLEPLAAQNPDVASYQSDQAGLLLNLFQLEIDAGDRSAGLVWLQRACNILKPLSIRFPAVPEYQRDLAVALRELAVQQGFAGEAQSADKNLNESLRIFAELAEKYPDKAEYANQLTQSKANSALIAGVQLSREGRWEQAVAEYSKVIEFEAGYQNAWASRGYAQLRLQKWDEAIADLREAVRLWPNDVTSQVSLASSLRHKRDFDAAIVEVGKALRLEPTRAATYYELGLAHAGKQSWTDAVASYREAIRLRGSYFEAQNPLGFALVKLQKFDEAIAAYQESIRLSPNSAPAHNSLAWLLATCPETSLRDPLQAVELATKAVELAPASAVYWSTLGAAHYRNNQLREAIVAVERSNQTNPLGRTRANNAFIQAMCHWQLGDQEQARESYSQGKNWLDANRLSMERGGSADDLIRIEAECAQLLGIEAAK